MSMVLKEHLFVNLTWECPNCGEIHRQLFEPDHSDPRGLVCSRCGVGRFPLVKINLQESAALAQRLADHPRKS